MEDNKVAVNKRELYKLINIKKYDQAKSYLYSEQNNIYNQALERLKPYIDLNIIDEEEIDVFLQIIEKNLIYNLLKNHNYVSINSYDLYEIIEKKKQLEKIRKTRRC